MILSKLDRIQVALFLFVVLTVPFAIFLFGVANGNITRYKQNNMELARSSLMSALNDLRAGAGPNGFTPKLYGNYEIRNFTNDVIIGKNSYHCLLITAPEEVFNARGHLAVTTNQIFIWFDNRGHSKIIPDTYKVSRWQTGY